MPPCVSKACRKNALLPAFSLIELLVVIAILTILAGIAIPVISNSSSNTRRTAREIVKNHLQQARAHAIATRNHTALIIPDSESGANGLCALSLAEVEKIDGKYEVIENEHGASSLLQRWAKLPKNMHFISNTIMEREPSTILDHEQKLSILASGKETECHMIVFAPNGQIDYPTAGSIIQIAIAQLDKGQIADRSDSEPVIDLLLVNRLTGKAQSITP
jgi:prepilin-type N-terminal cleavage/methylation domain-containing protein